MVHSLPWPAAKMFVIATQWLTVARELSEHAQHAVVIATNAGGSFSTLANNIKELEHAQATIAETQACCNTAGYESKYGI